VVELASYIELLSRPSRWIFLFSFVQIYRRMNLLLTILLLAALAVAKKPNILFVLTDDQGKYVGGLEHMPKLQVIRSIHTV
jgi:hypothetical protein